MRQLSFLTCLTAFCFLGCETNQSAQSYYTATLELSPYQRIGIILNHDSSLGTVVVRLDNQNSVLQEELLVRNQKLEVVAVIRPTGIRTGNSVGMVILRGEPERGQEVVQFSNSDGAIP